MKELEVNKSSNRESGERENKPPSILNHRKTNSRRIIAIIGSTILFVGILALVIVLVIPADTEQSDYEAELKYFSGESPIPLFSGALRIESLDGSELLWDERMRDAEDPKRQSISTSLAIKIRSAFEIEGFTISKVEVLEFEPITVSVYSILGKNATSLTVPAADRNNSSEIKTVPIGSRQAPRVTYQCLAMPSENVIVRKQVGAVEAGAIQFMLGSYLANRKVVAQVEAITVLDSFKEAVKNALQAVPRLANQQNIQDNELKPVGNIACHKTGRQAESTNSVFQCPAGCSESTESHVIGSHWYHIDSSICLAAIHAGLIQMSDGGVVEYLEVGRGFLFEGRFANGINSTGKIEFAGRFIVKRLGPSWVPEEDAAPPTHPPLPFPSGERGKLLAQVHFTLLKMDGVNIRFSLIGIQSSKLATRLRKDIVVKIRSTFELLDFRLVSASLAALEPLLHDSNTVSVKIELFGNYKTNAWALFPYKPWEETEIRKLKSDVSDLSGRSQISFEDLEIILDPEFLQELQVIPSTTNAPITTYPGKCGCGEVYFIQSVGSPSEADSIRSFYRNIFSMFDFDQLSLGLGLALMRPGAEGSSATSVDIVTSVGQDLRVGVERRLDENLKEGDQTEADPSREELWRVLEELEKDSLFLTQAIGVRKKLLVISSRFVFGPAATTNLAYLERVKRRGVLVAYVGFNWDEELLKADYYPQTYASQPTSNFVKHVKSMEDINSLASFVGQVIRRYICDIPPLTCAPIEFLIPPPDNLQFNWTIHEHGIQGSYQLGIPVGTGLKQYKSEGGFRYNNVDLPATSIDRKTAPDLGQAFYRKYQCGVQANQPKLQHGRIVGGYEAVPHSWPWTVSINLLRTRIDGKTKRPTYYYNFWKCGGSIIHSEWVVTAAHCFAKKNERPPTTEYQVVVGQHDQNDLTSLAGDSYQIKQIVYNPNYDDPRNKYDIALLQLKRPITYRREVAPVCLPNPDVIPATGRQCWLAGWGFTSNSAATPRNKLKQARQVIESPAKCQLTYRRYYYNPNTNLCSRKSDSDNVNMQCRGDSGGPLVCFENERWVLYGVSNFGPKSCENGGESGYFLVSSVLDWLCCYLKPRIGPCAYVKCSVGVS